MSCCTGTNTPCSNPACNVCAPRKVSSNPEPACDPKYGELDEVCKLDRRVGLDDASCLVQLAPDSHGVEITDETGSYVSKCIQEELFTEEVSYAQDPDTGEILLNASLKAIRNNLKIPYFFGIANNGQKYFRGPNDGVKRWWQWDGDCWFSLEPLPKLSEIEISGTATTGRILVTGCEDPCGGSDEKVYCLEGPGIAIIDGDGCVQIIHCDDDVLDCGESTPIYLGCCNGVWGMIDPGAGGPTDTCRTRASITPGSYTLIPAASNYPVIQWTADVEGGGGGSSGGYVEIWRSADGVSDDEVVWAEHTVGNYAPNGIIKSGEFSVECEQYYKIVGVSTGQIRAWLLS